MASSILQYLPSFFPEIKIDPLPERIFLSTIKALLVPAMDLSLFQWGVVGALILVTNFSPTLRKATMQLYGYLSLVIGAEIAFINSYVLLCSWISPSTTLQPLTVVTLNLLNSIIPVFTDSVILFHLVKEKASQSNSRAELIATTGTPVFLKFARLVSAVLFIRSSAEFICASLSTTKRDVSPNFSFVEAARTQSVYISSGLQLFDNVFSLGVYWSYINKIRELTAVTAPLSQKSLSDLVWTFGSQYILPIILNAVQLATASLMPSSNAATLIDSAKVVLNITSASVAALQKQFPISAVQVHEPLENTEDLSRVTMKAPVPLAPPLDVNEVMTAFAQDLVSEETEDLKEESETNEPTS